MRMNAGEFDIMFDILLNTGDKITFNTLKTVLEYSIVDLKPGLTCSGGEILNKVDLVKYSNQFIVARD